MDSRKILEMFYSRVAVPASQPGWVRGLWSRVRAVGKGWTRYLVIGSLLVAAWIGAHVFYYNLLVDLQFNVKGSWAQVEAQLQRRFHIQQNLTQIVIDYSQYEREMLTSLIEMRTAAMAGKAGDESQQPPAESSSPPPPPEVNRLTPLQLDDLFPNIMLVAEQYPQLKLTENFQQFSGAIIDTENQIAQRIMAYNDAVNTYTTTRRQFPGNLFGSVCGFPLYGFYTPDKEVLSFEPVKY